MTTQNMTANDDHKTKSILTGAFDAMVKSPKANIKHSLIMVFGLNAFTFAVSSVGYVAFKGVDMIANTNLNAKLVPEIIYATKITADISLIPLSATAFSLAALGLGATLKHTNKQYQTDTPEKKAYIHARDKMDDKILKATICGALCISVLGGPSVQPIIDSKIDDFANTYILPTIKKDTRNNSVTLPSKSP